MKYGRKRHTVHGEAWGVRDRSKRKDSKKGKAIVKPEGGRGRTLEVPGILRFRKEIGMKTYLHGPVDYAKTQKLRFRVGDLHPPERRGTSYH